MPYCINKELDTKHLELSWSFTRTLSHVFKLPSAIASGRAIELSAKWGRVKITSEALALAVSFQTDVHPRTSGPEASPPPTLLRDRAGRRSKVPHETRLASRLAASVRRHARGRRHVSGSARSVVDTRGRGVVSTWLPGFAVFLVGHDGAQRNRRAA
jgi:hypothetical protein